MCSRAGAQGCKRGCGVCQLNPTGKAVHQGGAAVGTGPKPNTRLAPLNQDNKRQQPRDKSGIQCFNCKWFGHYCKWFGHYWKDCTRPQKVGAAAVAGANDASHRVAPTLCVDCVTQPYTPHCTMEVNGVEATSIRDTGASIIVVAARLIREEDRTGRTSLITLADTNHSICCPTASVNLHSLFVCGQSRGGSDGAY